MMPSSGKVLLLALAAAIFAAAPLDAQASATHGPATLDAPDQPTPAMPLDEVRIGMKGYGLTVFKGTQIQPFPVTVISITAHDAESSPRRSVIWIESDDPRMLETGPVQGMSGSPIFLWDEGEAHTPGQGGRLVGAFAYGFAMSKGCIIGVQPIQYMREVGQRANDQLHDDEYDHILANHAQVGPQTAARTLSTLKQIAAAQGMSGTVGDRLESYQALINAMPGQHAGPTHQADPFGELPQPPHHDGQVMPMYLPLAVDSPQVAQLMQPLFQPMGIQPVSMAGASIGGPPPTAVNFDELKLEPGSVMAVPLTFGDLDNSVAGTVTDVLPDGTVIGFGHPMFGQGRIAMPMATGYVHFVVPRINISFKMSASMQLQGSIRQDEAAAVAGTAGVSYTTAPVTITVDMPGHEKHTYDYQVVNHPMLTASLATTLAMRSLTAERGLPLEHTIRVKGDLQFTGDRRIHINTVMTNTGMLGLMMELVPPIMMIMQNPFEPIQLTGMHLDLNVQPRPLVGAIINARLDRTKVAPGESIGVTVWLQPQNQPVEQVRLSLHVPADTPEGDYPLSIADGLTHMRQVMAARPHLFSTESADDLFQMIQLINSIQRDAIYATMRLPEQGLAMGRHELPYLPSSRRAMLLTPTSTQAVPFRDTIHSLVDAHMVIQGERSFTVQVRKPHSPERR